MAHKLTTYLSADQIAERVSELAREISASYSGEDPLVCICVLKGAFLFYADVIRRIDREIEVDFVRLASYGTGTTRGEDLVFSKDLEISIEGKDVLVVEDIVDSGHSMDFLLHVLSRRGPKSLKICALIDKHERRERNITVDFAGFKLSDDALVGFLVGYGMDYAERYRELDGLYELSSD